MKPGKKRVFISVITVFAATTLCMYPAFRTSAQTKTKPATTEKQNKNNASPKPAAKHPGSKMGDIDQKEIDKAILEVEQSMKEFNEQEWPKVQEEINKAVKEIDMAKIQQEIETSMKAVDMNAIMAEIQKAMAEVQQNLKEVDLNKIKQEMAAAMKQVDMKQIEKQLADVKKINAEQISKEMANVKEQMAKMKIDMKEQMANAGEQMKIAKKQLQLVRDGLDELEKDGFKKKGEKVNIEFKNGILYLNNNPQSKEVSDKYSRYFGNGDMHFDSDENDSNEEKNHEQIK